MAQPFSKQEFLRSEEADLLRKQLLVMIQDKQYNTSHRYTDGAEFITRHMDYMSQYPTMDHGQYILNLKLKLRVGPVRLNGKPPRRR